MIPLKNLRLREPLFAGTMSVTSKEATMFFDASQGLVTVKRKRENQAEYFVPLSSVIFMEPLREEAVVEPPPLLVMEALGPTLQKTVDDQIRMVKINGKIVERRGEPKQDELDAMEYAKMEADERRLAAKVIPKPTPVVLKKKPTTVAEMLAQREEEGAEDDLG